MSRFRVWPDGTVQDMDYGEPEPYDWMSDDFQIIEAETAEDAAAIAAMNDDIALDIIMRI